MKLPKGRLPQPTAISREHWRGAAQGRLMVQQCTSCSRYVFLPALACPYCSGDRLEWQQSSGRGVVHTYTTIHRAPSPDLETPYVVAVIALDEGWHMLSNIIGCPPDAVRIGMPVECTFHPVDEERALPIFRPAETR